MHSADVQQKARDKDGRHTVEILVIYYMRQRKDDKRDCENRSILRELCAKLFSVHGFGTV